jgi:hypothetical protein
MRADSIGMFWQDEAKVKAAPKEKIKRTPPEPVWERPDYLPGLEESIEFKKNIICYNDVELYQAAQVKERLVFDSEINPNYVLLAFRGIDSKKSVYFELDHLSNNVVPFDHAKLRWILENFCIINFNGRRFDFIITNLICAGASTEELWLATEMIIMQQLRENDIYKYFNLKKKDINIIINQILNLHLYLQV